MPNPNVPSTWFVYSDDNNPRPHIASKADYSSKNVAPLIESFASIIGKSRNELEFNYPTHEGNVLHPNDKSYATSNLNKSDDLLRYEEAAKRSSILKLYQDNSPAKIDFFN